MLSHRPLLERLEGRRLFAATAFYVDLTAPAGGNGSATAPWDGLTDVSDATFTGESVVTLAAGQRFAGTLTLDAKDVGPVTVTSNPANRATVAAQATDGVSVLNAAGVTISNLIVVGNPSTAAGGGSAQPAASYNGIEFENTLAGAGNASVRLSGVTVDNVEVYGFGRFGVSVGGSGPAAKSGFANVVITNAVVHDNALGGIETHGNFSATATGYANANVRVAYCEVYNNTGYANSPNHSGDGIVLSDVDGLTIERNVAHGNGARNTHVGGPVGIWVWDVNAATIQYNESYANKTNSTADGGGFDFDGGVTNSVMQYNYSHDNDGPGYGVYQFQGARPFHDNVVRYNVSADDARKNSYGALDFWNGNGTSGIRDTAVYNNTVYVSPSAKTETVTTTNRKGQTTTTVVTTKLGDPRALRFVSGTTNVSIRNNVFQTVGGVMLAQIDATQTNLQIQGNDWWPSGAAFSLKSLTKTYSSFSAFVSGTTYEKSASGQTVGRSVNPRLAGSDLTAATPTGVLASAIPTVGLTRSADGTATLDLAGSLGAFRLDALSTLRNAGQVVSSVAHGATDFFGDTLLPDPAGWSIGADELA
jgi:hypothetical protein